MMMRMKKKEMITRDHDGFFIPYDLRLSSMSWSQNSIMVDLVSGDIPLLHPLSRSSETAWRAVDKTTLDVGAKSRCLGHWRATFPSYHPIDHRGTSGPPSTATVLRQSPLLVDSWELASQR